jgi:hypothetical protein
MFMKFVKGPVTGMEPKVDVATLVLGELAGKRFNEYESPDYEVKELLGSVCEKYKIGLNFKVSA